MPFGLPLLFVLVAPTDDLTAVRAYIRGEYAAHANEILHPVKGSFGSFLKRNCIAGYRYIDMIDFKSFDKQLQEQKLSNFEKSYSKVEVRLVDLKPVQGGYGAVVYQTRTSVSAYGPSARREIEYQYWIKTRNGFRLKGAMVRYRHFEAKDYHQTFQPEYLRTIWQGPQPVLPAALLKELNARK